MFDYTAPRIQHEFMVGDRLSPGPDERNFVKVFDRRSSNKDGRDTEIRRRFRYGVEHPFILEDWSLAVHQHYVDTYGFPKIGDPPSRPGGGLCLRKDQPSVVVGWDKSVVLSYIPRLINGPSLVNLTEASRSYAELKASPAPIKARHCSDIKRYDMGMWLSEHHGLWHPTGHAYVDTLVPTKDTTKFSTNYEWASQIQYHHAMEPIDHRVDYFTWLARPDLYAGLHAARPLYRENPGFFPFDQVWHSSFPGKALLVNQQSGEHRDTQGVRRAWDILIAAGDFEGGELYLADSDIHVPFLPGDMVAFDGTSQRHEIRPFSGKLRVSHVYFIHRSVLDELGIPMKLEDLYLSDLEARIGRFVPNGPGGQPPIPTPATTAAPSTVGSSLLGKRKRSRHARGGKSKRSKPA